MMRGRLKFSMAVYSVPCSSSGHWLLTAFNLLLFSTLKNWFGGIPGLASTKSPDAWQAMPQA